MTDSNTIALPLALAETGLFLAALLFHAPLRQYSLWCRWRCNRAGSGEPLTSQCRR